MRFLFQNSIISASTFFLSVSFATAADRYSAPAACGLYNIKGTIVMTESLPELRLFAGSFSEIRLRLTPATANKAFGYNNQAVTVTARLMQQIQTFRGLIAANKIQLRNPYGETPNEITDGFELVEERQCDSKVTEQN